MKKLAIALLSLGLIVSFGCDEPADEDPAQEVEEADEEAVDQQDDYDDEEADEEARDDEEADDEADEVEWADAEDGMIEVEATADDFVPSAIRAPAGEELTVEFTRNTADGCMTEVVFPDLEIEEELPEGETVAVEVTPEEDEEIGFECGMGMGESTIKGS